MNITGFEYNLNSEIKYLDLDSSVSVTVAVVYQFGFKNIEILNSDYLISEEENTLAINFYNLVGREIEEVEVVAKYLNPFTDGAPFEFRYHLGPEDLLVFENQVQFTIDDISLDNSHFAGNIGLLFSLEVLSYKEDEISKHLEVANNAEMFFILLDDEIRTINSLSDLNNMESYHVYSLEDDLILDEEMLFEPIDFKGIFFGNGFTIENLTIRKDLSGLEGNYFGGLFRSFSGKITDLTVKNVNASFTNADEFLFFGALAGSAEMTVLDNIHLENVSIKAFWDKESEELFAGYSYYLGGLIGLGVAVYLSNSSVKEVEIEASEAKSVFIGVIAHMSTPFDDNKISYLTADKITIKTTNNDEEKIGGLFGSSSVNIMRAKVTKIKIESKSEGRRKYLGGLSGRHIYYNIELSYLIDLEIDSVKSYFPSLQSEYSIGGFVGYQLEKQEKKDHNIKNSYLKQATIKLTAEGENSDSYTNVYLGGLIGYSVTLGVKGSYLYDLLIIVNSTQEFEMADIGAFVGSGSSQGLTKILESFAAKVTIDVNVLESEVSKVRMKGLTGAGSMADDFAGLSVFGSAYVTYDYEAKLNSQIKHPFETQIAQFEINDINTYTNSNTLNWDSLIWNVSGLNYRLGITPRLIN